MSKNNELAEQVGEIRMSPLNGTHKQRYYIYVDEGHMSSKNEEKALTQSPPKKLANPAPIGLLGFGMTTILLNVHNTGFYPLTSAIVGMGLCYGGLAQLLAGFLEYARGNTFAYVAFVSYGSFWLSLVCTWMLPNQRTDAGHPVFATDSYFLGVYLLVWGIFTFFMFFCTLRTNLVLITVFGSLALLFFLLAAGNMAGSPMTLTVAGFEGIFCGSSAFYLALAEVINEVYGREVLPIGSIESILKKKKGKKDDVHNV